MDIFNLPDNVSERILYYLDEDELRLLSKSCRNLEQKKIINDALFRNVKCWGCFYLSCGQEAHYDGCLKEPE